MAEASIALKLQDNFSQAIVNMRSTCTPFRSDVTELGQELDRLNQRKVDLKVDLTRAKNELTDAKRAFKEAEAGTDEMEKATKRAALAAAEADYSNLTEQLSVVSQQARQTQKDILAASDSISRADNRAGARTAGETGGLSGGDTLGTLGKAGLMGMLGQSLGQVTDTFLGSALGGSVGSALSGGISGAVSGAAMGSLAGPVGTAIGAAVGGLTGLVGGAADIFKEQDDAFKSYVRDQYSALQSTRAAELESGGAVASGREDDLRVFSTLLDNDAEAAERFQASLIELGRTPPFSYGTVAALSKEMLGLGLSTDEASTRINALSEAAAALNLSESNVSSIVSYLESAQLAGKLDTRVVKSLSKLGVNAYEALADAFSLDQSEVMEQLGELDVDRGVQAIYDYMGEHFAGAAAGLTGTYQGALGVLESYQEDMQNAQGDAYNEKAKLGLQDNIAFLQGEAGAALEQMNAYIGEGKALAENLSGQYQREAMSALLLGGPTSLYGEEQAGTLQAMHEEYAALQKQFDEGDDESKAVAAANMERLKSAAEGLAEDAYNVSDTAKGVQEAERDLVKALQDNTAALQAHMPEYLMGQQQDKGQAASAFSQFMLGPKGDGEGGFSTAWTQRMEAEGDLLAAGMGVNSHATGLKRVPYDNYFALLHQDEEIVPASEARGRASGGGGGGVVITGNEFHIRQESDIQDVARELMQEIRMARLAGEYGL